MAKKALIERQRKREFLVHKYPIKRQKIHKQIKKEKSLQKKFQFIPIHNYLQIPKYQKNS